jgi:ribonucleoside-diphosphate reductase alpha chain
MPRRRAGHTTSVTIDDERFYLTANAREDGYLGEVFIQWGKQGTTGAGLMDVYAVALSVGLQHRVPLVDLIRDGLDMYFVPNGRTDDPEIPRVRSVVDYVARRLSIDWLPYSQRAELGIFTVAERMDQARAWMDSHDAPHSSESVTAFDWEPATGIGVGERSHPAYLVISVKPSCSAKSSKSSALRVASGRP